MRFLSVCSGIEAASVAWNPLGWKAVAFSEIEPFPCAVLAHHYPDVPNLGDMTKLPESIRRGDVEAPDVLCGGTPCQTFSVAGLRKSLGDARGNLSLTFCEIANAIDDVRLARGDDECIVFWENVPGVLSTSDNAFGCFLGALAGTDSAIVPRGRWTNAGVVDGPQRTIAWRVLDAQYFGVAQRRRRVFVVASARQGFNPAAVLFEFDGVRRDSAPSREAGQSTAATLDARTKGGGFPGTDGAAGGHVVPVCPTLRAGGNKTGTDVDTADSLVVQAYGGNNTAGPIYQAAALNANRGCHNPGDFEAGTLLVQDTTHTLRGEGFDASKDGTGRGTPVVAGTLGANHGNIKAEHAWTGQLVQQPVAFPSNLSGTQCAAAENLAPSMGAKNPTAVAHAIQAGALRTNPTSGPDGVGVQADHAYTLEARAEVQAVQTAMQVRRLTPEECEALQGFPRGYTQIPWRKKPASECPDGPRYKALGNSWAVPNVHWIGERINAVALAKTEQAATECVAETEVV